jgi:peptidoglycan/xylan/chitin deacetylase (PgdA/CDA1 family)
MDNRIRLYISACFYYSGLLSLVRWWTQRARPCLTILYYHQASRGYLRSHLLYLRRHYRILGLEKALEELYMPAEKASQWKDRRSLLALTFDDGYYDNYTHAFPLACELQIPITIFLIPGYVEQGNAFWWATRLLRVADVDQVTLDRHTYHLENLEERKALAQAIDISFSQCATADEREKFLVHLHKMLAVPTSVALKEEPVPLLTWAQVREMQESGWVSFGAHTVHHPDLGSLHDPIEVQYEVGACRAMLEQQMEQPVCSFAYPFGSIGDYGPDAVKQAGYAWAVTTIPGANTCQSAHHLLRRRNIGVTKHWLVMATETAGIWGFFSRLKGSVRHFTSALLQSGEGSGSS